jgi:hypothetical protein
MKQSDTIAAQNQQIQALAHELWVQAGRPQGREREHWAEAERQLGMCGDSPATLVAAHPQPTEPHPKRAAGESATAGNRSAKVTD